MDKYLFKQSNLCQKKSRKARKFAVYNCYFIGFALLPMAIASIFNWLVDPQDIFNTPNYWGINHEKTNKDNNDRLYKAVDIIRLQPDTIIVGSSRTKQGINPESAVLVTDNSVYNLAINGPNFYEVSRYIEHAIYNQPELKQIILGIDFFMFNQDLKNQPTFKESRLEISQIVWSDLIQNLFSIDTLNKSFKVVQASLSSPKTAENDYGSNGFMPNRNADNGETIWRFHQSIKLYYSLHSDYQFSESYWNDFKKIVQLAQENNIDLKVFISPAHATHWEAIYTTKKGDIFEQWKKDLVAITPVWDFSGYNSITTEPIAEYMDNYVDNSHYSPEIGNLILQRMFKPQSDRVPSDFGILLTPENIEQHLQQIKSDRLSWQKNHPQEYDLVQKFYAEVNNNKDE